MSAEPTTRSFDDQCKTLRHEIKRLAADVWGLSSEHLNVLAESDSEEMAKNLELAYRHLEDATMRLGKAIQAYDGGKSVYDK